MTQADPTDPAFAAVSSILDKPVPVRLGIAAPSAEIIEIDGYSRLGPGPFATIRVKWTARAVGDGTYVVDETIGDHDAAITSRPMYKDAALRFIDDRQQDMHGRFEQLKSELRWPAAAVSSSPEA